LEDAIIDLFSGDGGQGYTYVHGDHIHRRPEDILLIDDLQAFLFTRYASENLTENELNNIIGRLELIPSAPLYLGNRDTFFLINEGFDLLRDDPSKSALRVNYIDFDEPENNVFKVVNQYSVQGERLRRPDLILFINGIPVAILVTYGRGAAIKNENLGCGLQWQPTLVPYCRFAAIKNKNFLGTDPICGLRNSFPQTAPREAPQRLDPTPVLLKNKVFQQHGAIETRLRRGEHLQIAVRRQTLQRTSQRADRRG
jgi:hypothetical protein